MRAIPVPTALCGAAALAVGLALPGCASPEAGGKTVLAASPSAQTLVLLPLNVTAVLDPAFESSRDLVYEGIEDYLRGHGAKLKTVAFPSARRLWLDSIREARSGEAGAQAGFEDAARVFVRRLQEHAEFDAVVMPTLFVQQARIDGALAHWDGTSEPLDVERGRRKVALPKDAPIGGAARAASLHAVVIDLHGRKLQEKQAGLVLLSRVRMTDPKSASGDPEFTPAPIDDPFSDDARVRAGIAAAFSPYLPEPPKNP